MKFKKIVIVFVMFICASIFGIPIFTGQFVGVGENRFEISSSISQIIANLFVIFGVMVALWQYVIYSRRELELKKNEVYDMDKARIQKAIDLSEYFKDNVMQNYNPLYHVFKKTKVLDIVKKIPREKMSKFTLDELKKLISQEDIDNYKSMNSKKEFIDALYQICLTDEAWSSCLKEMEVVEGEKTVKKVSLRKGSVLLKYKQLLENTLNNLEFFAMHFTYGTADEAVVYQSLHNAYIDIVVLVYCELCLSNDDGHSDETYYTNTTELFNLWVIEAEKQREKEYVSSKSHLRKGKKLA
jgi:hypothetical protein